VSDEVLLWLMNRKQTVCQVSESKHWWMRSYRLDSVIIVPTHSVWARRNTSSGLSIILHCLQIFSHFWHRWRPLLLQSDQLTAYDISVINYRGRVISIHLWWFFLIILNIKLAFNYPFKFQTENKLNTIHVYATRTIVWRITWNYMKM